MLLNIISQFCFILSIFIHITEFYHEREHTITSIYIYVFLYIKLHSINFLKGQLDHPYLLHGHCQSYHRQRWLSYKAVVLHPALQH
jgi:hypothetical protein